MAELYLLTADDVARVVFLAATARVAEDWPVVGREADKLVREAGGLETDIGRAVVAVHELAVEAVEHERGGA